MPKLSGVAVPPTVMVSVDVDGVTVILPLAVLTERCRRSSAGQLAR